MAANLPVYIIPFGVDLTRFADPGGVASAALSPDKPVTLGFVKWLKPKYGPDVMVEAFAKIHADRPTT
jgi:glycosyltransferase involved in cell wall biosynthesis